MKELYDTLEQLIQASTQIPAKEERLTFVLLSG